MKKQIFILVFLVVAVFASVSKSYGQAVTGTTGPRAFTGAVDVTNPLRPVAGRPYTYSAVINPANGQAYWYATKSTTFMTAGARVATEIANDGVAILAGATNYKTLAAAGTSPTSTSVTWTAAAFAGLDATHPLFMVVEYNGPAPCTTSNNIKVMKIVPQNLFTIDITNMVHGATPTGLAYDAVESQCYAAIVSSSYNTTTNQMENDYGVNVLYYEVVASNFSGTFKPEFKLTGLSGTQTADIDWGTVIGTYGTNVATGILSSAMPYASVAGAQTVTTTQTNTSTGVSIYVRVTVKNNGYEGVTLGGDNITLAVDAVDGSANPDVDTAGVASAAFADLAIQTLSARPAITTSGTMTLEAQKP